MENQAAMRRLEREEYARTHKKKRHGKLFYAGIIAAVVVLLAAGGAFAYINILSGNLQNGLSSGLSGVLVKTDLTNEPFYMVLMGTDESLERDEAGDLDGVYRTDSMMLVRIDPVEKKATLVSLPRDTMVDMGQYGTGKLNSAYTYGGATLAVQTVSELADVDISHFALIDFDGFCEIVDALGGVEVDVPTEINDADAGGHLDAGLQTLTGEQALILCRSRSTYEDTGSGDMYRAANQRLVLAAIANKLLESDVVTLVSVVNTLSGYVTTDLNVTDLVGLAQVMQGMDSSTDIYSGSLPTTSEYVDDLWYEVVDETAWAAMMKRVDAGLPPTDSDEVDSSNGVVLASTGGTSSTDDTDDAASTDDTAESTPTRSGTVAVRNGNGISGAGTAAQELIAELGYTVDAGNASSFDYTETVVVYSQDSQAQYAQEIADTLGVGTIEQDDGTYYSYDADYLVVLGADFGSGPTSSSSSTSS